VAQNVYVRSTVVDIGGRRGEGRVATKSTVGIANFSFRKSRARKTGKSGLNQSLTYMHFLLQISPDFFLFSLFQLNNKKKKLFLGRKRIGGGRLSPTLASPFKLRV
jgi:hypothetical protein